MIKEAAEIAINNKVVEVLTIIMIIMDTIPNHMELVLMNRTDTMEDRERKFAISLHQDQNRCIVGILMETSSCCEITNRRTEETSKKPS